MMNIRHAASALGGDVIGGNAIICPGPGHSLRDRSLSVRFTGEGFTVHSHAGDEWQACKDHVRERLGLNGFNPVETPRVALAPVASDDGDRTARALALWRAAGPIRGTPAAIYLASRGVAHDGEALRWHPACPFGRDRIGCMVALVRNILSDAPQAIHRTAIGADGQKLSHLGSNGRMSLGPVGGGAVKLTEDADVTNVLAIGEGIETTLSIRQLPDLGALPIWALLSAGGVATFPALPGIETVWVAADHDASGTGHRAANATAARLEAANKETIIITPTTAGADLNDKVARHAHG
jgi:putative DNA primase/helicase